MAHLQALETRQNRKKRKEAKLALTKRLYERGYQREDIINLFKFIDWLMSLPTELEQEFQQELNQYEEEKRMPYITSVERMGMEKGMIQKLENLSLMPLRFGLRMCLLNWLIRLAKFKTLLF
jgi:hypothetical protein